MLEIRNFTTNEINEKLLRKITDLAINVINRDGTFPKFAKEGKIEISLAIVGNARIKKLNKMYRGKNRVTDVLSFGDKPAFQYLGIKDFVEAPDGINRIGEIIICYPQAKKQAREIKHSLEKEISFLLIHGILHLFGYEHEKDEKDAKKMREMEEKILEQLSIE
ncbi:rRNA maturation RNase YbeY [Patescibacteria group bacterium]